MRKKLLIGIIIVLFLVGGGFLVAKVFPPKTTETKENKENRKLTDKEIEEYLLAKRLDLEKYFVFSLQAEIKPGKHNVGNQNQPIYANNGRDLVPALSNHLSQLIGAKKTWLVFQGKYTNETDPEWSEDKLDEKINNGEEWFIIFDKTQIKQGTCNWFTNSAGVGSRTYPNACALAVENKEGVWIVKSKPEAVAKIKTDPFLAGKIE